MSLVRVDTIKPITSSADLSLQGDSGGSAVDCLNITSAGDVDFSGNTDAKIKLPSAGGIYESDGSTPILTESGGVVTLQNVTLTMPAGSVVQVVQTVKTDAFDSTSSNGTFADITGMTAAITPASTSNKILVQCSLTNGTSVYAIFFKIQHNGSGSYADISVGDTSGSRTRMMFGGVSGTSDPAEVATNSITFLDSPSKDTAFTYKVVGSSRAASTWTINRPSEDTDANYTGRGVSTLTLMEIKA